jgi:hypothetical protein
MHWAPFKIRETPLRSNWQGDEIVVTRGDELIDHLRADDIGSVTLVHADEGDSPGQVRAAIFELPDRVVWLGAASGIAGRVLFERQAYWSQRNCIYWVSERSVSWSEIQSESRWPFSRQLPQHRQLTPAAARSLLDPSDVTGPHTWDQRKQHRIERRRPFPGRAVDSTQSLGRTMIGEPPRSSASSA